MHYPLKIDIDISLGSALETAAVSLLPSLPADPSDFLSSFFEMAHSALRHEFASKLFLLLALGVRWTMRLFLVQRVA
jgi:hypothetical protein